MFTMTTDELFRHDSNKRHKCVNERQKPISEQHGATHSIWCNKWFRSKGGMTINHARRTASFKGLLLQTEGKCGHV